MADRALFRMPATSTVEGARRQDQEQRRNLRIAIRQLERAELYLVALYSLNLDDSEAEVSLDDIIRRVRSLRRTFAQRRVSA